MTVNTDRFRTYVTQTGFGLEALAKQQSKHVDFAVLVVGDGELPDSENPANQTDLINQVRHYPVTIEQDPTNSGIWIARAEIPADDGDFFIREAGVKVVNENGELYSYARQPGDYKPVLEEGSAKSYTIRLKFIPGNASLIEAKIDPSVQFATPTDLSNAIKEHEESQDPHSQYATDDDLAQAMQQSGNELSSLIASSQFLPYDATRMYKTGEVCYTKDQATNELSYWEWYSNVESLAGIDPLDVANRQSGWLDDTKPFYWSPYKKSRPGTPLFPWMSMTFPEGTLNVLGNSVPVVVFWRLALTFPEFVNAGTGMIDFPETGGEFFRVLDQSRGIDLGREFNSHQKATLTGWNTGTDNGIYTLNLTKVGTGLDEFGSDEINASDYPSINLLSGGTGSSVPLPGNTSGGYAGGARPRNLAFPILVEV